MFKGAYRVKLQHHGILQYFVQPSVSGPFKTMERFQQDLEIVPEQADGWIQYQLVGRFASRSIGLLQLQAYTVIYQNETCTSS